MSGVYDVLKERGFVEQVSDESKVRAMLEKSVTCYIGFDPTSDSFHAGSLVPIMALAHMQRHGHRVLAVVGGGTAMIGDPSGKTELRQLVSKEEIDANAEGLKRQLAHFLDFSGGTAFMVNNADWLRPLNYIEFLRDVGRHFSVNKMLAAESYRMRLETGLNFIEFNYMLLQAYDYLELYRRHGCTLQMGGNDQWGNILAGADLIRRVEHGEAEALTFPLLTTATGAKMGKTEKGAVWLDPKRTSPYEYYQYWINADDRDVGRFLALFTLLPMDEVRRLASLAGEELREAKEILALEATKMNHGESEAFKAREASRALFSGEGGVDESSVPTVEMDRRRFEEGIPAFALFADAGLAKTRGEARRLIAQGGGYVNGRRLEAADETITAGELRDGALMLRAGKKKYARVKAS
ncbi:MAG: tyrosine--tRNA ligase [Candidatus Krumholzibacteria bacterium]|nr:tyrosine--tRNA ligase [Candidatus Krumholzibacteria bacterium]